MSTRPPLDQQCVLTILCQGNRADGQPYWAYLELSATKAKAFKKAQGNGAFNLEDFGTIVEWGLGANVPEDTKERMEREHGVNHDFQQQAQDIMRKKSGKK